MMRGDDFITPARVNDEIIGGFVTEVRGCLDRIDRARVTYADKPANLVYSILQEVSAIKSLSSSSTKEWAMQWFKVGASRSTIARAINMSWSGIDRWVNELNGRGDRDADEQ